MNNQLSRRLDLLGSPACRPLLSQGLRGIERETLRVDAAGHLAHTPHPRALGSALTHPQITTDYAETLLEFITPAQQDIGQVLASLDAIHRFAHANLGGEMLWSQSMPCTLPSEEEIEIAWYGSSHMGMLKHVYRRGLALRYGKAMQCIAGIHYNYSLSEQLWQTLQQAEQAPGPAREYQSENYFALIRNFRRYGWLLMYLFGASPALSKDFLRGRPHQLQALSEDTLYLPFATSLRMSDLGYQNDAQAGLTPHENSLESYVKTLSQAVNKPYPPYEAIGTQRNGEWVQISTNVLQIENEYYSTIRPKRVIRSGERPIQALCARGVQYIEVRCLDVDPFEPVGISAETGRFMDIFLLFCALDESPAIDDAGTEENTANFALTVKEGRRPGLQLQRHGTPVELRQWGFELLDRMTPIAQLLDEQHGDAAHMTALNAQRTKLEYPDATPSAQVLHTLGQYGNSFSAFGLHQSQLHAELFRRQGVNEEEQAYFTALAEASLAEQREMELPQEVSFDEFVAAYRASTLCKNTGLEA